MCCFEIVLESDNHVKVLTERSTGYEACKESFIADEIFPIGNKLYFKSDKNNPDIASAFARYKKRMELAEWGCTVGNV